MSLACKTCVNNSKITYITSLRVEVKIIIFTQEARHKLDTSIVRLTDHMYYHMSMGLRISWPQSQRRNYAKKKLLQAYTPIN